MTLTDPREALADQSSFIDYLVGLAGLARVVHTLAADGEPHSEPPRDSDDFVHVLLGLASLGDKIERLAEPALLQRNSIQDPAASAFATARWLR
jgi:hypothetical protein